MGEDGRLPIKESIQVMIKYQQALDILATVDKNHWRPDYT